MPAEGGERMQVTKNGGWEAFESFDGITVYYSKLGDPSAIWKVPTAGGEETRFLADTLLRYWTVGHKGIYFITREDRFLTVNFIDFVTRQITALGRFERTPAKDSHAGLTLSPTGVRSYGHCRKVTTATSCWWRIFVERKNDRVNRTRQGSTSVSLALVNA